MFMGMGMPIPDLSNLPGVSRPGKPGGGGAFEYTAIDNNFSMEFDGAASYFDTGQIDITGAKSVSFWIYPTASGNDGSIFTMVPSGATSDVLSIGLWQSNIQALTASGIKQRSLQTISINTWYHVVVVKATNSITNIYINGVNETLDPNGTWNGTPANPQSKIGEATYGSFRFYYTGNIDELAVFNGVVSEETIQAIYNTTANNPGKVADLSQTPEGAPAAWYRMGD